MNLRRLWLRARASEWSVAATPFVAIAWLASILVLILIDQIGQLPPPPPTPAQAAAARPRMMAIWRAVHRRLLARLPYQQPRPPELGAVWATRKGQVCGLIDEWHTGVDVMTQFYTVRGRPFFRDDEDRERLYVREWSRCIMDPYVVIHAGSLATGACATRAGQAACLTSGFIAPAPVRAMNGKSR